MKKTTTYYLLLAACIISFLLPQVGNAQCNTGFGNDGVVPAAPTGCATSASFSIGPGASITLNVSPNTLYQFDITATGNYVAATNPLCINGTASPSGSTWNSGGATTVVIGTNRNASPATNPWAGVTSSTLNYRRVTPTAVSAGADQNKCNTTTFTLAATAPTTPYTGLWTSTGTGSVTTTTSATSGVTGVTAGNSLTATWTVQNGTCAAASGDPVVLTNYATATVANAGTDQNKCNTTTFTLAGNTPTVGTGLWTSTGTGSITTNTSPTSGVTGVTAGNSLTATWTITNGA